MKYFLIAIMVFVSSSSWAAGLSRYPSGLGVGVVLATDFSSNYNFTVVSPLPDEFLYTYTVTDLSQLANAIYTLAAWYPSDQIGNGIIKYPEWVFKNSDSINHTSTWDGVLKVYQGLYTTDPVTIFPIDDTTYINLFQTLQTLDPSLSELKSINLKMDKIVGDPVNDTLVPEQLRGKITQPQYFALMGVSGLLSAFVVMQIWSRAF